MGKSYLSLCLVWRLHRRVDLGQVEGHLRHEPLEGLALQLVADGSLVCQVPRIDVPVQIK